MVCANAFDASLDEQHALLVSGQIESPCGQGAVPAGYFPHPV